MHEPHPRTLTLLFGFALGATVGLVFPVTDHPDILLARAAAGALILLGAALALPGLRRRLGRLDDTARRTLRGARWRLGCVSPRGRRLARWTVALSVAGACTLGALNLFGNDVRRLFVPAATCTLGEGLEAPTPTPPQGDGHPAHRTLDSFEDAPQP